MKTAPQGTLQMVKAVEEEPENPDDIPTSGLDPDAYGVGILCTIQGFDAIKLASNHMDLLGGFLTLFWGIFVLAMNFLIQVFLMLFSRYYVMEPMVEQLQALYREFHERSFVDGVFSVHRWHQWGHDQKSTLCQIPLAAPYFFLTVLLLWSFVMVGEVRACLRVLRDVINLPVPTEGHELIKVFDGGVGIIMACRKTLKAFIVCVVILPKMATAGVLWYIGSRWLSSTPAFADLILNACALSFVVDVDEMIYKALIPEAMQIQVERTSIYTMRMHVEEVTRIVRHINPVKYLISMGWFVVAMFITAMYIFKWQRALPGYQWDIPEACEFFVPIANTTAHSRHVVHQSQ